MLRKIFGHNAVNPSHCWEAYSLAGKTGIGRFTNVPTASHLAQRDWRVNALVALQAGSGRGAICNPTYIQRNVLLSCVQSKFPPELSLYRCTVTGWHNRTCADRLPPLPTYKRFFLLLTNKYVQLSTTHKNTFKTLSSCRFRTLQSTTRECITCCIEQLLSSLGFVDVELTEILRVVRRVADRIVTLKVKMWKYKMFSIWLFITFTFCFM
jgi:hypothetical protein